MGQSTDSDRTVRTLYFELLVGLIPKTINTALITIHVMMSEIGTSSNPHVFLFKQRTLPNLRRFGNLVCTSRFTSAFASQLSSVLCLCDSRDNKTV
jgi:hypothetical protein